MQVKKYINVFYIPNPKRLVEEIDNDVLETNTPVYPIPYHIFLVHGALYYFYFSNKVFKENSLCLLCIDCNIDNVNRVTRRLAKIFCRIF